MPLFIRMTYLISLLSLFSPVYAGTSSIDEKYLSILGFKLEETHLSTIQEKLGQAPIHRQGTGANAVPRICYYDETNKATIYFESSPMGGQKLRLMSFTILATNEQHDFCGILRLTETSLRVGELALGGEINTVTKLLPQPIEYIKGYGYLHKHFSTTPFSAADIKRLNVSNLRTAFWSVSIYIEVFESHNIVDGFKVSKLTSW